MELNKEDERFMREALKEAKRAFEQDEVPIGAVIVCDGMIIARAYNYTEHLNDVTAHAEMQAITSAANNIGGKYLQECTLYVTIEPCVMCAGALFWAQIGRIVYAADDPKRGFSKISGRFDSAQRPLIERSRNEQNTILHPRTKISKGILQEECSQILKTFFEAKRREGQ